MPTLCLLTRAITLIVIQRVPSRVPSRALHFPFSSHRLPPGTKFNEKYDLKGSTYSGRKVREGWLALIHSDCYSSVRAAVWILPPFFSSFFFLFALADLGLCVTALLSHSMLTHFFLRNGAYFNTDFKRHRGQSLLNLLRR